MVMKNYSREQIEKVKKDLIEGELKPILEKIKTDDTLNLEISTNHIWVYYRGGGMIQIIPLSNQKFNYKFNIDYSFLNDFNKLSEDLKVNVNNIDFWVSKLPELKASIDLKRVNGKKEFEKQCQQCIVRDNNYVGFVENVANHTDYFIADIEYPINTNRSKNGRVDFLALKLPSNKNSKKLKNPLRLVLMELKYMGKSAGVGLSNDKEATISRHVKDLYDHLYGEEDYKHVIKRMSEDCKFDLSIKFELGIVMNSKTLKDITILNDRLEYIIIIVNYKPLEYKNLLKEIEEVINGYEYKKLTDCCDMKIAYSSMMGYGLYENCMITLEEAVGKLKVDIKKMEQK